MSANRRLPLLPASLSTQDWSLLYSCSYSVMIKRRRMCLILLMHGDTLSLGVFCWKDGVNSRMMSSRSVGIILWNAGANEG